MVSLGTAVMILAGVPVPEVITFVVMMVMGDLIPGLLVTPGKKRQSCNMEGALTHWDTDTLKCS